MDGCVDGAPLLVAGGGDGYKGAWTDDEDQLLQRHVDEAELDAGGRKRWTEIAKHVPRRNGKQCRERWTNHLQEGYVRGRVLECAQSACAA